MNKTFKLKVNKVKYRKSWSRRPGTDIETPRKGKDSYNRNREKHQLKRGLSGEEELDA